MKGCLREKIDYKKNNLLHIKIEYGQKTAKQDKLKTGQLENYQAGQFESLTKLDNYQAGQFENLTARELPSRTV